MDSARYEEFLHMRPPQGTLQVQHTDHYCKHGKDQKGVRKIFEKVQWDDWENQKVAELKVEIEKEQIQLPIGWKEGEYLKFVYTARGKINKCIQNLKKHLEWRLNPQNFQLTEGAKKFLDDGIIYTYGRDKQYRPIVVFNVYKIDPKKMKLEDFNQAIQYTLSGIKKHMFEDYHIENWVIIIETNNAGILSFPFKAVSQIIECTQLNYTSTMDTLYIMNPAFALYASWKMVEGLLDPDTAQKIRFIKNSSKYGELLEKISPDQLEQKYGGTAPNQTSFWPPVNTYSNQPLLPSRDQQFLQEQQRQQQQLEEIKMENDTIILDKNTYNFGQSPAGSNNNQKSPYKSDEYQQQQQYNAPYYNNGNKLDFNDMNQTQFSDSNQQQLYSSPVIIQAEYTEVQSNEVTYKKHSSPVVNNRLNTRDEEKYNILDSTPKQDYNHDKQPLISRQENNNVILEGSRTAGYNNSEKDGFFSSFFCCKN